jgi:acyl carrier protein
VTTPTLHQEIKQLIIEALQLEDVDPASISDTDVLFGAGGGLNLDSIDALELATAIARKYDVAVSQDQETRDAFRSVQHLVEFVEHKRAAAGKA